MTRAVAVVPVRDGTSGKTRLAGVLPAPDRARLVVALARHVVATLLAADDVARVVVVTADVVFARGALSGLPADPARLDVVAQASGDVGLDAAVDRGRAHALAVAPGARLLVVHADLPALTAGDVAALLATGADVTVAPDRAGSGTNAVVLDAAAASFRTHFGPDSCAAHRREAVRRGLGLAVVRRPGTTTDLDTVADWDALPGPVRARVVAEVPAMARLRGGGGGSARTAGRGVVTGV